MLAKVTIPPFSSLNDVQRLVVTALRMKSKTTHELKDELQRNYSVVNRAINDLKSKGWIEVDPLLSGGRANSFRLRQVPTDAVELMIDNGIEQKSVSFNRYFESVAKQLKTGKPTKIERAQEDYLKAIAMVGYYAAVEFTKPGSVSEPQLLEPRAAVQRFVKTLEEVYTVAQQILNEERLWHADTLAEGVMRKTDRYLTPGDMALYAKTITDSFASSEDDSDSPISENESEEETDNADD